MANVADMQRKTKWCGTFSTREEEWRGFEILVMLLACPNRRERHHVGEVECGDRRLADVGVDMAGQAAEPGFDGVDGFADAGEIATLNSLLDQAQFLFGGAGVFVPNRHSRSDIDFTDQV